MCRGVEIAHYWCELAGVECKFDELYPNEEKRSQFIE